MPIDFDNDSVDVSGVDDRRGSGGGRGGGGLAIGGGVSVVGVIIYLLVTLLGGGEGGGAVPGIDVAPDTRGGAATEESTEQFRERCNTEGALDQHTDCRIVKVYSIANTVWEDEFARRGLDFNRPRIAFFRGATQTGCGAASAEVGPFYCPPDQEIFFELDFLEQLQSQFGARGEYAQAYIVAHEYGHHLQTILGTEEKVRAAQQRNPGQANKYSVAMELQADCYAGVWAVLSDKAASGIDLTKDNIAEAVQAAQAVGDDRIQQKTQGRVNPESWTHGSAAQRQQWFLTGYNSGDVDRCNTFT